MPPPDFNNTAYTALLQQIRDAKLQQLQAQGATYDARGNVIRAQGAGLDAQAGLFPLQYAALGARQDVVGARTNANAVQRQYNAAQGQVIGASEANLADTRGLLGLQQQQVLAEGQDLASLRAARGNVADKVAVAQEKQRRGTENQRVYGALGVAAPTDVDVQLGQEGLVGLGQRATLQTQEDIVRGQNQDKSQDRALVLKGAQLAHDMQATNVTEAELAARRVGLTLAEANLMVEDAQNRASLADITTARGKLGVDQADLATSRARLGSEESDLAYARTGLSLASLGLSKDQMRSPEDAGYELYRDPVTRELTWLSPAEADAKQYQYQLGLTRGRLGDTAQTDQQRRAIAESIQSQTPQHPMKFFDDSDFILYLVPGMPASAQPEAWQPREEVLLGQVRDGLRAKYPGISEQAVEVKARQYLDAARKERARLKDAALTAKGPSR